MFNQDIGNWNTEKVTSMYGMFFWASAFDHDIGSWNTAQVTDMGAMFYYASAFNQNISSWTGTAATTAQGSMFSGATAFKAKFTCDTSGPANSCDTIESTWIAPSPPPSPPPPPAQAEADAAHAHAEAEAEDTAENTHGGAEEMPAGAILCPGYPTADYCDCAGDCNKVFCSCDDAKAPTCCDTPGAQSTSTDGG